MVITLFVLLKIKQGYNVMINNPKLIMFNLLFLLLVLLLTLGGTNYLTSMHSNKILIRMVVFSFICITSFFKNFVPYYKPVTNIIPDYYPIKKYKSVLLNIVNDFISLYYLHILVFLLIIECSSGNILSLDDFLFCILLLLNISIFIRILQTFLEYKIIVKKNRLIWALLVALLFFCLSTIFLNSKNIYALIILMLLLWVDFNIESAKRKKTNTISVSKGSLFLLSVNNIPFRSSLLLYLAIKVVFLIGSLISVYVDHLPQSNFLIWIVLSPLILFSFIFNNLWGYFKNVWLNIYIRNNRFREFALFYLKMLLMPIVIDFLIMLLYVVLANQNVEYSVIVYFTIACLFVSIGLLSSVYYPKMVTRKMLFKQDSSKIVSVLEIVYICFVLKMDNYVLILLITCLIATFLILLYIKRVSKSLSAMIYAELYK